MPLTQEDTNRLQELYGSLRSDGTLAPGTRAHDLAASLVKDGILKDLSGGTKYYAKDITAGDSPAPNDPYAKPSEVNHFKPTPEQSVGYGSAPVRIAPNSGTFGTLPPLSELTPLQILAMRKSTGSLSPAPNKSAMDRLTEPINLASQARDVYNQNPDAEGRLINNLPSSVGNLGKAVATLPFQAAYGIGRALRQGVLPDTKDANNKPLSRSAASSKAWGDLFTMAKGLAGGDNGLIASVSEAAAEYANSRDKSLDPVTRFYAAEKFKQLKGSIPEGIVNDIRDDPAGAAAKASMVLDAVGTGLHISGRAIERGAELGRRAIGLDEAMSAPSRPGAIASIGTAIKSASEPITDVAHLGMTLGGSLAVPALKSEIGRAIGGRGLEGLHPVPRNTYPINPGDASTQQAMDLLGITPKETRGLTVDPSGNWPATWNRSYMGLFPDGTEGLPHTEDGLLPPIPDRPGLGYRPRIAGQTAPIDTSSQPVALDRTEPPFAPPGDSARGPISPVESPSPTPKSPAQSPLQTSATSKASTSPQAASITFKQGLDDSRITDGSDGSVVFEHPQSGKFVAYDANANRLGEFDTHGQAIAAITGQGPNTVSPPTDATPTPPTPVTQSGGNPHAPIPHDELGSAGVAVYSQPNRRLITPARKPIDVHFKVVSSRSLVTSHNDDFSPNPNADPSLQYRWRDSPANQLQVNGIAANPVPHMLGDNPLTSDGAPIAGSDLQVEAGHGRVMGLRKGYASKSSGMAAYRGYVLSQAAQMGLEVPKDASGKPISDPILIRVRDTPVDANNRGALADEMGGATNNSFSVPEQAARDAQVMRQIGVLDKINPDAPGGIFGGANQALHNEFVRSVASETDRNELADNRTGMLTEQGRDRISAALAAAAYDKPQAVQSLLSAGEDSKAKTIGSAMVETAPAFARNKALMRRGDLHDADITPNLSDAAALVNYARKTFNNVYENGKKIDPVDAYLSQTNMGLTGDAATDPLTERLFEILGKAGRDKSKIIELLSAYNRAWEATREGGLASDLGVEREAPPTKEELLNAAYKYAFGDARDINEGLTNAAQASQDLFAEPTEGSRGTPSRPATSPAEEAKGQASDNTIPDRPRPSGESQPAKDTTQGVASSPKPSRRRGARTNVEAQPPLPEAPLQTSAKVAPLDGIPLNVIDAYEKYAESEKGIDGIPTSKQSSLMTRRYNILVKALSEAGLDEIDTVKRLSEVYGENQRGSGRAYPEPAPDATTPPQLVDMPTTEAAEPPVAESPKEPKTPVESPSGTPKNSSYAELSGLTPEEGAARYGSPAAYQNALDAAAIREGNLSATSEIRNTKQEPANEGVTTPSVTDAPKTVKSGLKAKAQQLREEAMAELRSLTEDLGSQANIPIQAIPRMMPVIAKLGASIILDGIDRFSDFKDELIKRLGNTEEELRPFLANIYKESLAEFAKAYGQVFVSGVDPADYPADIYNAAMAMVNSGRTFTEKRGVISDKQLDSMAENLGLTVSQMLNTPKGFIHNAEAQKLLRSVQLTLRSRVETARRAYESAPSDENFLAMEEAKARQEVMLSKLSQQASETARALRVHRFITQAMSYQEEKKQAVEDMFPRGADMPPIEEAKPRTAATPTSKPVSTNRSIPVPERPTGGRAPNRQSVLDMSGIERPASPEKPARVPTAKEINQARETARQHKNLVQTFKEELGKSKAAQDAIQSLRDRFEKRLSSSLGPVPIIVESIPELVTLASESIKAGLRSYSAWRTALMDIIPEDVHKELHEFAYARSWIDAGGRLPNDVTPGKREFIPAQEPIPTINDSVNRGKSYGEDTATGAVIHGQEPTEATLPPAGNRTGVLTGGDFSKETKVFLPRQAESDAKSLLQTFTKESNKGKAPKITPELRAKLLNVGGYLFEQGKDFRRYADWEAKMRGIVGDRVPASALEDTWKRIKPEAIKRAARESSDREQTIAAVTAALGKDQAQKFLNQIAKIDERDPNALREYNKILKEARRADPWDAILTLRKAGLLSSTRTLVKVTASHAAFLAMEELKRIPAAAIDAVMSKLTGGERTTIGPDPYAVAKSVAKALSPDTLRESGIILRHGEAALSERGIPNRFKLSSSPDLPPTEFYSGDTKFNGAMDKYINFIYRTHGALYHTLKVYALERALREHADLQARSEARDAGLGRDYINKRKAELFNDPPEALQAKAIYDAEVATFINENQAAGVLRDLKFKSKSQAVRNITEFLAPFPRVPSNVVARIGDYAGLGALTESYKVISDAITGKEFTPENKRNFANAFGRAGVGASLIALGAYAASKGLMTGEDSRYQDKGSIKLPNGKWLEIGGIAPFGNILAFGAGLYNDMALKDKGLGESVTDSTAGLVAEQPMISAAQQVAAFKEGKMAGLKGVAGSMAGSFIPTIISDASAQFDKVQRRRENFTDYLKARTPLRTELKPLLEHPNKPEGKHNPEVAETNKLFDAFSVHPMRLSQQMDLARQRLIAVEREKFKLESEGKRTPEDISMGIEKMKKVIARRAGDNKATPEAIARATQHIQQRLDAIKAGSR